MPLPFCLFSMLFGLTVMTLVFCTDANVVAQGNARSTMQVFQMPRVIGLPEREAQMQLPPPFRDYLRLQEPSDRPAGEVTGQDPPYKAYLRVGQRVTLTVSNGQRISSVQMPDFLSTPFTFEQAEAKMRSMNRFVRRESGGLTNRPAGQISGQIPPPNADLSNVKDVTLYVSEGSTPSPTETPTEAPAMTASPAAAPVKPSRPSSKPTVTPAGSPLKDDNGKDEDMPLWFWIAAGGGLVIGGTGSVATIRKIRLYRYGVRLRITPRIGSDIEMQTGSIPVETPPFSINVALFMGKIEIRERIPIDVENHDE